MVGASFTPQRHLGPDGSVAKASVCGVAGAALASRTFSVCLVRFTGRSLVNQMGATCKRASRGVAVRTY